jgi:predicted RNase H-like HicB family nuclease
MNFPVVIHKDPESDYGVTVPDLPGCFSAGRTLDEAVAMAREAIALHIDGLLAEGGAIPQPHAIEEHRKLHEYREGTWAIVSVDVSGTARKPKRITVTLPPQLLSVVDRFAEKHGENRSDVLVRAVTHYLSEHQ